MAKKESIEIEIISDVSSSKTHDNIDGVVSDIKAFYKKHEKIQDKFNKKAGKVFEERAEIRRKVSLANKRLRRLEAKGMTDNPAYVKSGGYFSVKGKNHNQLQAELARLNRFINATTSTIRGTNNYLKEMAANTGVKYDNLTDLRKKSKKFFELSSKVEQYLRNVEDMASAINYAQIWEQINVYVKDNRIDLSKAKGDIDGMIKDVSDALKEYNTTETVQGTTFRLKK